jgi:hypothetical protein
MYAPFPTCVHHFRARFKLSSTLPSALFVSDSCARCTLVFPIQPALLSEVRPLAPRMKQRPAQGRSHRNPAFCSGVFRPSSDLCRCQSAPPRVVQRFVFLTANPEMVQQDRQLPGHCDDGALPGVFASMLRQLQSPSPEIRVHPAACQSDVLFWW